MYDVHLGILMEIKVDIIVREAEKRRHHERISLENGRGNGVCLLIFSRFGL